MKQEIRRILIVDDEAEICQIVARILRHENFEVEVANNGNAGLEILRAREFHMVLCDIKMPQMDGLELLRHANADGIMSPFVFITGYSDRRILVEAVRCGAIDFVDKPFNNEEIIEVAYRATEIGYRKRRMFTEIQTENPALMENLKKDEKVISLLRISKRKRYGE